MTVINPQFSGSYCCLFYTLPLCDSNNIYKFTMTRFQYETTFLIASNANKASSVLPSTASNIANAICASSSYAATWKTYIESGRQLIKLLLVLSYNTGKTLLKKVGTKGVQYLPVLKVRIKL